VLDLIVRMSDQLAGSGSALVAEHGVMRLVWFEPFMLVSEARDRKYAMKKWRREWKINLIERENPDWDDLYPALIGGAPHRSRKPAGSLPTHSRTAPTRIREWVDRNDTLSMKQGAQRVEIPRAHQKTIRPTPAHAIMPASPTREARIQSLKRRRCGLNVM
jgi:putative endonuclease